MNDFVFGAQTPDQIPKAGKFLNQIAFVGRSNVGKSSLINAVFESKLCRTSKTPGRTRQINYFSVGQMTIVDLPGYGFANIAVQVRKQWDKLMQAYFENNSDLKMVFILIDARRGLMDSDRHMISFLGSTPYTFVLTKADKVKDVEMYDKAIITSAAKHIGLKELKYAINQCI